MICVITSGDLSSHENGDTRKTGPLILFACLWGPALATRMLLEGPLNTKTLWNEVTAVLVPFAECPHVPAKSWLPTGTHTASCPAAAFLRGSAPQQLRACPPACGQDPGTTRAEPAGLEQDCLSHGPALRHTFSFHCYKCAAWNVNED